MKFLTKAFLDFKQWFRVFCWLIGSPEKSPNWKGSARSGPPEKAAGVTISDLLAIFASALNAFSFLAKGSYVKGKEKDLFKRATRCYIKTKRTVGVPVVLIRFSTWKCMHGSRRPLPYLLIKVCRLSFWKLLYRSNQAWNVNHVILVPWAKQLLIVYIKPRKVRARKASRFAFPSQFWFLRCFFTVSAPQRALFSNESHPSSQNYCFALEMYVQSCGI